MEKNDAALKNAHAKIGAAYGAGAEALPWDTILAALLSLLAGCLPAQIKSQSGRPLVQIRMSIRLLAHGVPSRLISRVVAATVKAIHDASDDELAGILSAAQEIE